MEKVLLIAGCSHASGSEIDGTQDSAYNRQHSFGNILAHKLGYTPINIAEPASTNPTIARSIIEWTTTQFIPETMEVGILIAWTESSRMEAPANRITWYNEHNLHYDWIANSGQQYWRINSGWKGGNEDEIEAIPSYHRFMASNGTFLEILSANLVLQIQYFLTLKNIKFLMCNTMHMFTENPHLTFYTNLVDSTKYMNIYGIGESFYWKYHNAGHSNSKAQYWHHNETPHSLFSEQLYDFAKDNKCL